LAAYNFSEDLLLLLLESIFKSDARDVGVFCCVCPPLIKGKLMREDVACGRGRSLASK
jgi:hypothetical protein